VHFNKKVSQFFKTKNKCSETLSNFLAVKTISNDLPYIVSHKYARGPLDDPHRRNRSDENRIGGQCRSSLHFLFKGGGGFM
jgi:hypothetical protein